MKLKDIEFNHRNVNVLMKFHDGFAPVWEAYVRWPGYKNRKYFTLVPAWRNLPSDCIELVKQRIDVQLCLAWIDITTQDELTHRYQISAVTNSGEYIFTERTRDNRRIRFNLKENCLEYPTSDDDRWAVYVSSDSISKVEFWNRS